MKRTTPLKRKSSLKRRTGRLKRRPHKTDADPELQLYYSQGIEVSNWKCENCNDDILHATVIEKLSGQAHILPKKKYRSVRGILFNRLHLCLRCHCNWDSSWHKAKKMIVWELAMARLQKFIHMVKETLPEALNINS